LVKLGRRLYIHCELYGKTSEKDSLGLHKLKEHRPWFDEEYLGCLGEKKRAKMQCTQDPSQRNLDNLKNLWRDFSTHFRKKKA